MEKPATDEGMSAMVKKMREHLSRYPRCNSKIVRIRGSVFVKLVTDENLLEKEQVRVHEEALSLTEV